MLKIDKMKIPIRQDITVIPADPKREPIGFIIKERIGIGIINKRAICESLVSSDKIDWSKVNWDIGR